MNPPQSPLLAIGAFALLSCTSTEDSTTPADTRQRWPARAALNVYASALDDAWAPHDEQNGIAVDVIFQEQGRHFGFEVIGLVGGDDLLDPDDDQDFVSRFIGAGAHASFAQDPPLIPFVGVGVAFTSVEVDNPNPSLDADDDSSLGLYLRVGIDWVISDSFFLGLAYQRMGGTNIEIDGFDEDDVDGGWVFFRAGIGF